MKKFFHDLLFVEEAVYTLWGSKPIAEVVLYHFSEEEYQALLASCTQDELENCYYQVDYDLPENWERWEKIQARFPKPHFKLFRAHYSEDGKLSFVYLVNVPKTIGVLQKHYDLFADAFGHDFIPQKIVEGMHDMNSQFWKNMNDSESSSLLWGILFGYGRENSIAYSERYRTEHALSGGKHARATQPDPVGKTRLSFDNLLLPGFISFFENDEIVKVYEKERSTIKSAYQKVDVVDLTLTRLCSRRYTELPD